MIDHVALERLREACRAVARADTAYDPAHYVTRHEAHAQSLFERLADVEVAELQPRG